MVPTSDEEVGGGGGGGGGGGELLLPPSSISIQLKFTPPFSKLTRTVCEPELRFPRLTVRVV